MSDRFYLSDGEEVRGPYAKDQLRSMWGSGQITAASLYCAEGSQEWRDILELELSASDDGPTSNKRVEVVGTVETRNRGSGAVAAGSVMSVVGIILACIPDLTGLGILLLLAGFVTAVAGRLKS